MPTNIYNVPVALWTSMTADEQALFNYRFAGGIQNADVRYHPTFNSHITFNKKPTTAMHSASGVAARTQNTAYAMGDVVSYEGQDYVCTFAHTGSAVPGFMDFDVTAKYFTMSSAYAPYAASMFNSTIVVPRAPGKAYALGDLVSYNPRTYTPWANGVLMTAGDLISNAGIEYVVSTTHTSGTTFDDAEATNFEIDTFVQDYVCDTAHTSTWAIVLANFTAVNYVYWTIYTAYTAGDYVKYLGQTYVVVTSHTSTANFQTVMFSASEYTARLPSTVYNVGNLISYNGVDYIVVTGFTSGTSFDATNLSADVADLTLTDIKNIKTYFEALEIQQPIPWIVTGVVGSEINTDVAIVKKFFDVMYNDLIKQTVHTVKNHTQFNI